MSYNSRLREARKNAGLTQTELGNMVGCAKTTITGYETGKSEPSMAMLSNIMHALNVDANFIFQDGSVYPICAPILYMNVHAATEASRT